jgi:hypothetical protein
MEGRLLNDMTAEGTTGIAFFWLTLLMGSHPLVKVEGTKMLKVQQICRSHDNLEYSILPLNDFASNLSKPRAFHISYAACPIICFHPL